MDLKKFMQNAFLLTATGLLLRAAGLLLRVLLANVLGEAGMGLYSLVFTVYNLFVTLAQSGIAVAVTRLVAQYVALGQWGKGIGAFHTCLRWSALLSGGAGAVLFLSGRLFARLWVGNATCGLSLRVLAFSLPFMALSGCFSGYFLARREVRPNCLSQILEQTVRLIFSGAVLLFFKDGDQGLLLALTVFANTLSEGVSCLFLWVAYLHTRPRERGEPIPRGSIRRIALPVAASRYLSTALHSTENFLIPLAISRYCGSYRQGLAEFGALKGMAIPLLFFPASFLTALSSLLVPEVTDTASRRDWPATRRIITRALNITVSLSVMISGVFFVYGMELGEMLFHSQTAGKMLRVLAPITPFMYLDTIADGLLKGMDLQRKTLRNNTVDSVLRILLITVLVPLLGMNGFLGVMVFSNLMISCLNVGTLLRSCCMEMAWNEWFLKPLAAAGLATAVWALVPLKANLLGMGAGAAIWCAVYLFLYWLTLTEKTFIIKGKKQREEPYESGIVGMVGGSAYRGRRQKR